MNTPLPRSSQSIRDINDTAAYEAALVEGLARLLVAEFRRTHGDSSWRYPVDEQTASDGRTDFSVGH